MLDLTFNFLFQIHDLRFWMKNWYIASSSYGYSIELIFLDFTENIISKLMNGSNFSYGTRKRAPQANLCHNISIPIRLVSGNGAVLHRAAQFGRLKSRPARCSAFAALEGPRFHTITLFSLLCANPSMFFYFSFQ